MKNPEVIVLKCVKSGEIYRYIYFLVDDQYYIYKYFCRNDNVSRQDIFSNSLYTFKQLEKTFNIVKLFGDEGEFYTATFNDPEIVSLIF